MQNGRKIPQADGGFVQSYRKGVNEVKCKKILLTIRHNRAIMCKNKEKYEQ